MKATTSTKAGSWLDADQVVEITGMSRRRLDRACQLGQIAPAKKVGRCWYVHRSALGQADMT